jgi:hypothetical protein
MTSWVSDGGKWAREQEDNDICLIGREAIFTRMPGESHECTNVIGSDRLTTYLAFCPKRSRALGVATALVGSQLRPVKFGFDQVQRMQGVR